MTCCLEYDDAVRRWISASVAIVGLLLLPAFLASGSSAQINGVPASVTSLGFGGHPGPHAPPASVTSLGPRGFSPNAGGRFLNMPERDEGRHRHHRDRDREHSFIPYYGGLYAVPSYPYSAEDAGYEDAGYDEEPDYQGGSTVFDRRGRGDRAYLPPPPPSDAVKPQSDRRTEGTAEIAAVEAPQPPTTLVFKDGRRLEVGNYAIVGATMLDLTPGHPRKIALADVDLEATQKENEDHGVSFQLPSNSQAN
jgi:hypothetical protein